jgi:hypothetical protein
MRRSLSPEEARVLDALLEPDWPGSKELRQQARVAEVVGKCGCGCATVEFAVDKTKAPQAPAQNPAPIEGTVWNQDRSQVVGGILLFVPRGWLSSLEIYSVSDDTITVFPPLDLIDFELSK